MPRYKFTLSRTAIYTESYTVEADSEEEALALAHDGNIDYDNNLVDSSFIDWYDDEYSVDEREDLCPLTKMVKEYDASLQANI